MEKTFTQIEQAIQDDMTYVALHDTQWSTRDLGVKSTLSASTTYDPSFTFNNTDTTEILRIDAKGFTYKGVLIEDAGEAYKAFIETMNTMRGM